MQSRIARSLPISQLPPPYCLHSNQGSALGIPHSPSAPSSRLGAGIHPSKWKAQRFPNGELPGLAEARMGPGPMAGMTIEARVDSGGEARCLRMMLRSPDCLLPYCPLPSSPTKAPPSSGAPTAGRDNRGGAGQSKTAAEFTMGDPGSPRDGVFGAGRCDWLGNCFPAGLFTPAAHRCIPCVRGRVTSTGSRRVSPHTRRRLCRCAPRRVTGAEYAGRAGGGDKFFRRSLRMVNGGEWVAERAAADLTIEATEPHSGSRDRYCLPTRHTAIFQGRPIAEVADALIAVASMRNGR